MKQKYTSMNNYYDGISDDEWASGDIEILNMHKYSHSVDDNDWDDDMAEYEDKNEMNELLKDPLTEEERTVYTRRGVPVKVERNRARKNCPRGRVTIISWNTLHIKNQFDSYLRRFGTRTNDYTPLLHWEGQDGPYAIAWEDLSSLIIPWNRKGFYIFLSKCTVSRKRPREYNDDDNDKPKKRRKQNKNTVKNYQMRQSRLALMELLDDKYVNWIRGYKKKRGLVSRLIYLHDREHWDKDMLQRLIFDNYMAFDIKDKINEKYKNMKDVDMNKTEINEMTKSILEESKNTNLDFRNTGNNKTVERKFWSTVWEKGFDADLKTIGYNDNDTSNTKDDVNTNNGHIMSNNNDNELLEENEKLKSELEQLRQQVMEIQNTQNIMPKIQDIQDID